MTSTPVQREESKLLQIKPDEQRKMAIRAARTADGKISTETSLTINNVGDSVAGYEI